MHSNIMHLGFKIQKFCSFVHIIMNNVQESLLLDTELIFCNNPNDKGKILSREPGRCVS